jgi:hypothetical protein
MWRRIVLSREQELDLTGMAYHWGTEYDVSMSDGVWRAIPHAEPDAILTAESADGLRSLIRVDHAKRIAKPSPLLGERMST